MRTESNPPEYDITAAYERFRNARLGELRRGGTKVTGALALHYS
jgi:hypothetical protein